MSKKNIIIISLIVLSLITIFIAIKPKKETKPIEPKVDKDSFEIKSISFVDNVITLKKDEEYELTLDINPINYEEKIEYIVSDESVITLIGNKIKALKEGTSTVTVVTEKGLTTDVEVVVENKDVAIIDKKIEAESLKIKDSTLNLYSGKSYQINYDIYPENYTEKSIYWETTDARVATVTDSGNVFARMVGSATLTAFVNGKESDKIIVNVKNRNIDLSEINVYPKSIDMDISESYKLNIEYIPSNASDKTTKYYSSNSEVAYISREGIITALKSGTSIITITSNGKSTTMTVNVKKKDESTPSIPVNYISLSVTSITLNVLEEQTVTATINPSNASNKNLSWSSSNNNVVSVNNGKIKALKEGTATITVTSSNNKKATLKVEVKALLKDNSPKEIYINLTSLKLKPKETKQLKTTVLPLSASQEVTWVASSDCVTVSNTGLVKANKTGKATVSAITKNGLVAKIEVTVGYPDITEETRAKEYGLNKTMSDSEIRQINDHLNSYMEEAALKANGISSNRARTLAAAYFLTYNPYYRVRYLGNTMDYVIKGWNKVWSTSNGGSRPTGGLDCYSFLSWAIYQGTGKLVKINYKSGKPIRYSSEGTLAVNDIVYYAKPGDVLVRTAGATHYAMVYSVNKDGTLTIIHSAGSSASLTMTTYPRNTHVKFNILFSMEETYGD